VRPFGASIRVPPHPEAGGDPPPPPRERGDDPAPPDREASAARTGRIQKQIQKQPIVKGRRRSAPTRPERFEGAVSTFLDFAPIATKSDVERIDRKVSAMGRKLKEMEKAQGGSAEV
jgi:hypothetical protein